jgi:hypothetical protein
VQQLDLAKIGNAASIIEAFLFNPTPLRYLGFEGTKHKQT